jgi:hypothetical protein
VNDFLDRYVSVVEIVFAIGLICALPYSISEKDNVTTGAIIGGILGYLRGFPSGKAVTPPVDPAVQALTNFVNAAQKAATTLTK